MCESVPPELGHTSRYIGNEEMSISGGPSRKLVFFRKASSIQSKNNQTTKNLAYKKPLKYTRPHKIDNSCLLFGRNIVRTRDQRFRPYAYYRLISE